MRILIHGINFSPELTGIGKYSGEMAEWRATHGHEVRVVLRRLTIRSGGWLRDMRIGGVETKDKSPPAPFEKKGGAKSSTTLWKKRGMVGGLSLSVMGACQAFRFEACVASGKFCAVQFSSHVRPNILAARCGGGG